MKHQSLAGILGLLISGSLYADQYHYFNVIGGDRAMGLGGAFCGVSDDASGLIYNPAGLAFALSNDISGSANAFYSRKVTYKKTIGTADFVEESGGSTAPFFGGMQKLDNIMQGLVFAFGIYTPDSELKDQDDLVKAKSLGIERFHRTVNLRAATTGFGAAVAKRVIPSLSLGLSLSYLSADELVQEYQDAHTYIGKADNNADIYQILTQNIRQHLKVTAYAPALGIQWAVSGKISLGLHYRAPQILSQSFETNQEITRAYVDGNLGVQDSTVRNRKTNSVLRSIIEGDNGKDDDPIGKYPDELRVGMAWFASPRFLYTLDVIRHGAAQGSLPLYYRDSVLNYASGLEYYMVPSIPLRLGVFTNNDARPKLKKGSRDQRDHIDYLGESAFLAWVQPNSQISVGLILQQGSGEAQKVSGTTAIQKVVASSQTFAFSATHSF